MKKGILFNAIALLFFLFLIFQIQSNYTFSGNPILKRGMFGSSIIVLQKELKSLGFFNADPTGYFGNITEAAVINFQKRNNINADGKVGPGTAALIDRLLGEKQLKKEVVPKIKVVIDPGHGGEDLGTVAGMESESKITLDISTRIQAELEKKSYEVILTRNSDMMLNKLSNIEGTIERKDLDARTNIINDSKPKLFLSIHVNSDPENPQLSGSIVYYNPSIVDAKTLAEIIQKELNEIKINGKLRARNIPEAANFYILRNSNIPGVLIETAYATNNSERNLLSQNDFRDELAHAITRGIEKSNLTVQQH